MRLCNKAVFAVLLAGAALLLPAQQPPAQPAPGQAAARTVMIPVTITDHKDRLVTSLGAENIQISENNVQQEIASTGAMDQPATIGILLDLSGSMSSKLDAARDSILKFIRVSNSQDEFFVLGFNDRVGLIKDFTNSAEDIQSRLAVVQTSHRTALSDAIHDGLAKMEDARYPCKALLVVSDGGDNASKHSESEVRMQARRSNVEIFAIAIFDPYAATPEERTGPQLLSDLSDETGGRLFRVDDIADMGDIAEKISTELRNQYVIGYRPKDLTRDGKWRKVKVKVNPPSGLPPLTVHARTGYYAPLQ
jgi:Ca-activated chloride channel family protein